MHFEEQLQCMRTELEGALIAQQSAWQAKMATCMVAPMEESTQPLVDQIVALETKMGTLQE